MRKQRRQSAAGSSASKLSHQIRSLNLPSATLADDDAVAHHLRSSFPHYSRLPQRAFSLNVRQALHLISAFHSPSKPPAADAVSDDDGDQISSSSSRSRKKPSRSEDRLLDAEEAHLRNYRKNNPNSNSSDSSTSTSESEDAIFEAKFEPEFDLTKSMLRANYGKQIQKQKQIEAAKPKRKVEEDNMEIENANEKKRVKMGRTTKGGVSSEGVEDKGKWKDGVGGEMGKKGPKFKDLGGMKGVIEELMMEVIVPLCHPQLPRWLGVKPMAGVLFHGPPGCGKTMLAHAIATETKVPFYMISATEVVSGVSGASEENIRDLFSKAYRTAPSIVFIDEIDAIASKRENLQREMERRIVTQLMTCMDESHQILKSSNTDSESETSEKKPGYVLVIGATNRPDAVDQALRRPGRFDREIALGVPDENARLEILSVLTKSLRLEGEFNLMKIARSTPGFVGADLQALVDKAGNLAMKRVIDRRRSELEGQMIDDWWRQSWTPEEVEGLYITMTDFEEATKMVQPSSRREGFSSIPNTKWEDVGGLNSLRKEFERYIVQRIKNPEDYEELGVNLEVGFLLYGPPGCGKTLIAKAVANEAGANFIHIKGPEILNKYVGESELAVRTIFTRARTCAPCILFFDEVDALTTTREQDGGLVDKRLVNQLLVELDGAGRQGVYVIGATNRLEVMDSAFVRPGRFGKVIYVPLPSAEERGLILKTLARNKPVAADVDLDAFGRREACQNLSGADLSAVINEAAMAVLDEKQVAQEESGSSISKPLVIETSHFEKALKKIKPSVSERQRIYYESLSKSYGAS